MFYLDLGSGFLGDLPEYAFLEGLLSFEYASGRLPLPIVAAPNGEHLSGRIDDDARDAHGVRKFAFKFCAHPFTQAPRMR